MSILEQLAAIRLRWFSRQYRADALKWITSNGTHLLIEDSNGTVMGGPKNFLGRNVESLESKPKGRIEKFRDGEKLSMSTHPNLVRKLMFGQNRMSTTFADDKKRDEHFEKHVRTDNSDLLRDATVEGYVERARNFLNKPCGDSVIGYVTDDGCVCRFDYETCEYAKGYPGGVIKTYMVAKVNKESGDLNRELAWNYFNKWYEQEAVK